MRALTADEIVSIWERASGARPAERAVTMLEPTVARADCEALWSLSLGERNARLLELREATFGARMRLLAGCRHCSSELECTVAAPVLRAEQEQREEVASFSLGGVAVTFRALTSDDLAAAQCARTEADARKALVRCAVVSAAAGDQALVADDLSPELIAELARRIEARDPLANVTLTLVCPACGFALDAAFDIAAVLWTELGTVARRLMEDVSLLARAYGWSEADILSMSEARRGSYVALALA